MAEIVRDRTQSEEIRILATHHDQAQPGRVAPDDLQARESNAET
jgi:hypothetical protein